MKKTRALMAQLVLGVAKEDGYDFVLEHDGDVDTLSYGFDLLCELKKADIRIIVSDKFRVEITPELKIPAVALDRVGELLMRLNLLEVGNFNLDYDTGFIHYFMDVRFEDITKPVDIEFLWLVPLAVLENRGKALMGVLQGEITPRQAIGES